MKAEGGRRRDELYGVRGTKVGKPEWTRTEVLEFPGSVDGPWSRYIDPATVRSPHPNPLPKGEGTKGPHPNPLPTNLRSVPGEGTKGPHPSPLPKGEGTIGTVRWPRVVPKDADCAAQLKKRTLTNLYNQRPQWLQNAHEKLDAAVIAAYGWDPGIRDEELLERLLELNLARTGKS